MMGHTVHQIQVSHPGPVHPSIDRSIKVSLRCDAPGAPPDAFITVWPRCTPNSGPLVVVKRVWQQQESSNQSRRVAEFVRVWQRVRWVSGRAGPGAA